MTQPSKYTQRTAGNAIKVIHVARRELALTDDQYRDMLFDLTGKDSLREMTPAQLNQVIDHLKTKGFKVRTRQGDSAPLAINDAQINKVRSLWLELRDAGKLRNPSDQALMAYVERITKKSSFAWLSSVDFNKLIESLKNWVNR